MKKSRKHKRRSCLHKQPHKSEDAAYAAISQLKKKNLIFHKMVPYKCIYCKQWHIGRTPKIEFKQFKKLRKV